MLSEYSASVVLCELVRVLGYYWVIDGAYLCFVTYLYNANKQKGVNIEKYIYQFLNFV